MKKILLFAVLLGLSTASFAQDSERPPMGGPMNPEEMAARETDELNKLVGLDENQYNKILKFNKSLIQNQMNQSRPSGGPEGGMGGPGGMPPGGGMGGPGGMPPGGGMGGGMGAPDGQMPPQMGEMPEMTEEMKAEMEARMEKQKEEMFEKRCKKYKKILTSEQYDKWFEFETTRQFNEAVAPKAE